MFGSLTPKKARGPAPRRARGDDGAAMVEAAIVMPLLMLLVFGIIEWGLAFLTATSTNSAARSGARTASALTLNTTYADQARLAVESNLSGAIPFATPARDVGLRGALHESPGLAVPLRADELGMRHELHQVHLERQQPLRTIRSGAWPAASMVVCGVPPTTFDSVGVYLKVRHNFVTNFFGSSKDHRRAHDHAARAPAG